MHNLGIHGFGPIQSVWSSMFLKPKPNIFTYWLLYIGQSAGAVEYTDCFSAEE